MQSESWIFYLGVDLSRDFFHVSVNILENQIKVELSLLYLGFHFFVVPNTSSYINLGKKLYPWICTADYFHVNNTLSTQNTYLQMILSVRSMRLVIPLRSFLLIWSDTHTGVSVRANVRGVSPSLFMMSMSAPLDRNNLHKTKTQRKQVHVQPTVAKCLQFP